MLKCKIWIKFRFFLFLFGIGLIAVWCKINSKIILREDFFKKRLWRLFGLYEMKINICSYYL